MNKDVRKRKIVVHEDTTQTTLTATIEPRYGNLYAAILEQLHACPSPSQRIYHALLIHADRDTGECWPSYPTIAKMAKVYIGKIARYLKPLIEARLVERIRQTAPGRETLYRVIYPVLQDGDDPAPGRRLPQRPGGAYPSAREALTPSAREALTPAPHGRSEQRNEQRIEQRRRTPAAAELEVLTDAPPVGAGIDEQTALELLELGRPMHYLCMLVQNALELDRRGELKKSISGYVITGMRAGNFAPLPAARKREKEQARKQREAEDAERRRQEAQQAKAKAHTPTKEEWAKLKAIAIGGGR